MPRFFTIPSVARGTDRCGFADRGNAAFTTRDIEVIPRKPRVFTTIPLIHLNLSFAVYLFCLIFMGSLGFAGSVAGDSSARNSNLRGLGCQRSVASLITRFSGQPDETYESAAPMSAMLYDTTATSDPQAAAAFLANALHACTEYAIIGTDPGGRIHLWNEGARRLYGFAPEEVVGSLASKFQLIPQDLQQNDSPKILDAALAKGKWKGTLQQTRGNGQRFTARVVITPQRDAVGQHVGFLHVSEDISKEVGVVEELKSVQFYTRSLIESNIDALMTTDPLGIITDVNRQMQFLTGHDREHLIGSAFKDYFTDPKAAEEAIKLVLRESRVTNYELTAIARDGRTTVVSYNAATLRDADGKLQGVFAAARDITEQRKLESQLRDSEAYNRGLIEASMDGLIAVDPRGLISDINAQMERISGYSREELIGTPFADYFAETDRAIAGIAEAFEIGLLTDFVLTLVSKEAKELHISFNASVFKFPSGKVRGIFASARDVTDQDRLQARLAEDRAYNRGLIEASLDALIAVDSLLVITDVNETMCQLSGYSRQELTGSQFPQYFADVRRAADGVLLTLTNGAVRDYELALRTRAGDQVTVSFNASVFRGANGKIDGVFASARDISDQVRLIKELATQQLYNRSLFEASVDAMFAVAPDGSITDVNTEAARLTGYLRRHLLRSQFSFYFTDPHRAQAGVLETIGERRVINYNLVLVTRKGRQIAVSFNAGVFTDAAGAVRGILVAARDITEQQLLEQQFRDQQYYTRSLIESNIDALMATDSLGNVSDANQQMELLTGCSRMELIGTPFKAHFTDPVRAEDAIRQVLREGKVTDYDLTVRARDGRQTLVSCNASTFLDHDGKLQGVFAAARDVTERRLVEQALQEKNVELEKANQTKDRFLANMSHELRTPLNAIIGFTGTLLMKLPGPLNAEQEDHLQIVERNANQLLSLINDLLDLAKIESGNVELQLVPVLCQGVIDDVVNALAPIARQKGIELTSQSLDRELPVCTDRRALSQILLNLTSNALKFTEHGTVHIKLQQHDDAAGHVTDITVVDTGIGIRREDQDRLFGAFQQVERADKLAQQGTGLGLHLSQKLAKLLGGEIDFESEPGRGSAFTLSIREK